MKKIFCRYIVIGILILTESSIVLAQEDTIYNGNALRQHSEMYNCFIKADYACFTNFMAPELIQFVKEKAGLEFIELIEKEMSAMKDMQIGGQKSVKVLQSIKTTTQYQKIIESLLEIKMGEINMVALSYSVGFSADGKLWKFMRLNGMPEDQLFELFPIIDRGFKLPMNRTLTETTIAEIDGKYKTQYLGEEAIED
jgi:predicted XRE-type DNA-binding protein